jgi:F-type H+-transporting ATPase subunit gamma
MPNLKDIKRRMGSVKNTQKITHAMKLVSAAKFARANQAVIASRPYGGAFDKMVSQLVGMAGETLQSPLLRQTTEEKKILVVLIATDRGLCGALNSNHFKNALKFVRKKSAEGATVDIVGWGRRAFGFSKKLGTKAKSEREKVLDKPTYDTARTLAEGIVETFIKESYDSVYLAYVEFKSALVQSPRVRQLLPVQGEVVADSAPMANLIVEPSPEVLLESLLKKQIASIVFRALLEGNASEQGARMTAMDSATKNAKEVVRKLSLQYNRGRQAAITKELIEITSGADAL